jgi:hypothetical protein
MPNLDQYESVFRAAAKEAFRYEPVHLGRVLVITDLDPAAAGVFTDRLRQFLGVLAGATWETVHGGEFRSAADVLRLVAERAPDLICTYRNLHSDTWQYPHSLGEHLDVQTQITTVPVLVLPHPRSSYASEHAMANTDRVMAITDHLTGDHRLVNHAVALTQPGGELFLTHIESERTFARYLGVIAKIPTLDTDEARKSLRHQLLKEPHDYIHSCAAVLDAARLDLTIREIVTFGHRLADYKQYTQRQHIDLLVLNTKDDDQLAMHGLAYPLAVELRQIPLLML